MLIHSLPLMTAPQPTARLRRSMLAPFFATLALLLGVGSVAHAQSWEARYDGPADSEGFASRDFATAIVADGVGNVYVTGTTGTDATEGDYTTVKYNSAGVQIWVRHYDGGNNSYDYATALAVDGSGNVYVTGQSDDGTGANADFATVKYNSAGVQQWVRRYNGPTGQDDGANALALDSAGNVYVTGSSYGTFDSSTGSGDGTGGDCATIKYNSAGVQLWVSRYNNAANNNDSSNAIAVDNSGNVYIAGFTDGPNATANYLMIKYSSSGAQQWVRFYDGPGGDDDYATAIALNSTGDLYITGYSEGVSSGYDYATIKYNSSGAQLWLKRYNGPASGADFASAIAVDSSGAAHVTGRSFNGANASGGTGYDYATLKYTSTGIERWVQRYNGPGSNYDAAYDIALDVSGNVYITGESYGGAETNFDYATIKYNSVGVQQWLQCYNGPGYGNDIARAVAVDTSGNVYVTGQSYNGGGNTQYGNYIDYLTVKYAIEKSWTPVAVGVNRTDNTSRLLWRETTDRYALWKLSATGALQTGKYYGPIGGYTCEQITVAPNGQTSLLWKNPTQKQFAIWTVAADLSSIIKATTYNYPAGYSPQNVAADASSNLRLSLRRTDNSIVFWTITATTGGISGASGVYGPYTNLQDGPIAVGQDGRIRLAWRNTQIGASVLWTIPATYGAPSAGVTLPLVPGARIGSIGVGQDNKARLQWAYPSGRIALWKINTVVGGNGAIEAGAFYGPIANVGPLNLSVGGDNQTRQLWKYGAGPSTGKAALWVINAGVTGTTAAYTFGPIQ